MKVTKVETLVYTPAVGKVLAGDIPPAPFILVRVHTDEGLVGLGQTVDARTEATIHDLARRFVLGRDPLQVERLWRTMYEYCALHGYSGAEARGIAALDIALWDVLGQAVGAPIHQLLGGSVRPEIAIYNTCSTFGDRSDKRLARDEPQQLVEELLAAKIHCLKWNTFDVYAGATRGQYISAADLREGVARVEAIAEAGSGEMSIMIEGHAKWNVSTALEIAGALEGLPVRWMEDMVWGEDFAGSRELRDRSPFRIAAGERLLSAHQVLPALQHRAVDVLISDVTWAGGISETRRIATLAGAHGIGFALHDHSGPVNLWASAHVLAGASTAFMMETTRVFYEGYYDDLIEGESVVRDGHLHLPEGPGLGLQLSAAAIKLFHDQAVVSVAPGVNPE